ncbi:MAG: hypothetical protein NC923_03940 [Candidatus Omnitrophica bacterium]|nr:hypothetical protein [Candidatus Omnitrophota bacterium]
MSQRVVISGGVLISIILLFANIGFAEDANVIRGGAYPVEEKDQPQIQWAWGEVLSVDPASGTVVVKYFDYDSGQDKELSITVDEKTNYENISKIDEIKPGQNLSVDYYVLPTGKNIAMNISLEKTDEVVTTEEAASIKAEATATGESTVGQNSDTGLSAPTDVATANTTTSSLP